ncbi:MAG TPA: hypothetical protein VG796_30375 [Verrucomicrobiales bacterium]|jgi:hypothetical protein|nr:hypothetical protein [Verrucomicrobiales bacterium]
MQTALLSTVVALAIGISPALAEAPPAKPPAPAPDTKQEGARLSKDEAIRLAREELARLKVNAEKYNAPTATYYRKQKRWYVSFMGKKPMPGNHCSVSIDDETGKAKFAGGA